MREERIIAKIYKDGKVAIDVEGIQGEKCLEITQQLEEALGIVTKREAKAEMHERPVVLTTVTTQNITSK